MTTPSATGPQPDPAGPTVPPRPARSRYRYLYVGLGLAVATVVVMLAVGLVHTMSPMRMTGTLTLTPSLGYSTYSSIYGGYGSSRTPCATIGTGFSDITSGADVVVRNDEGRVVGTGVLGSGRPAGGTCVYDFDVADVERSDYYSVEISHRGEITVTADQVATGDVHITLGS